MGSSKFRRPWPLHDPVYIELAEMLRTCREEADLSQRDLARLLSVPDSYVGKCERRDRRIDPVEMIRWCLACKADPIEMMRRIRSKTRLPAKRKS
jgi:transcriptional regulator with XRE-family HTH domain